MLQLWRITGNIGHCLRMTVEWRPCNILLPSRGRAQFLVRVRAQYFYTWSFNEVWIKEKLIQRSSKENAVGRFGQCAHPNSLIWLFLAPLSSADPETLWPSILKGHHHKVLLLPREATDTSVYLKYVCGWTLQMIGVVNITLTQMFSSFFYQNKKWHKQLMSFILERFFIFKICSYFPAECKRTDFVLFWQRGKCSSSFFRRWLNV